MFLIKLKKNRKISKFLKYKNCKKNVYSNVYKCTIEIDIKCHYDFIHNYFNK